MRSDLQSNHEVVQGMQNVQKEYKANMDMMNKQLSHLANSMSEMKGSGRRPPTTLHISDKVNVNKITLRSETSYKEPELKMSLGESSMVKDNRDGLAKRSDLNEYEPEIQKEGSEEITKEPTQVVKGEKPSPYRFVKRRKNEDPVHYLSIFGKLEVTEPFLQAMKLPPFTKFIKEFIVGRARKNEKIVVEGIASAMVQEKLPPKRVDPVMFTLPVTIGNVKV